MVFGRVCPSSCLMAVFVSYRGWWSEFWRIVCMRGGFAFGGV